ncbi:hypothetical protein BU204_07130 [Actinophytocola xanthii]|uniref:Low molecular weight protein antigen 6 PH domain-containing protein n=1 Tax=Actinophytocola xanthii TaxID=1912961 RepID=A0A1Q8CVP3_9PSEU|nr:hypothetical protein BU204_07130 [Actinophytocola xanthii]
MSSPSVQTWAPRLELAVLAWVLAVAAGTWAVFTDDAPGRILLGAAALVFALTGLFCSIARPRLTADVTGVTVRGLAGSRSWPWAEVNVRLVRTRRLGRESTTLELDADRAEVPDLVVLGRLDLGADPEDVVEALLALRT